MWLVQHDCAHSAFARGSNGLVLDRSAPAANCAEWDCEGTHCKATHSDPTWQALRRAWKAAGGKPSSAAATSGAANDDEDGGGGGYQPHVYVPRLSCDEFLARIQQVYPREETQPATFPSAFTLRPYQRQSLAFMLDVERANDAGLLGQRAPLSKMGGGRRHYIGSAGEVWRAVEGAPKQPARGGWLCDEVGMGKTAVIAALIQANPATDAKPVSDAAFNALLTADGVRHSFKLTVVLVNNTLVQQVCAALDTDRTIAPERRRPLAVPSYGFTCRLPLPCRQWADELLKFAPR